MSSPDAVHFSIENFNEDFNMLTIIPRSNILELNFVHPDGHKTMCFEWIGRSWIFTLCENKSVRLMWNNPKAFQCLGITLTLFSWYMQGNLFYSFCLITFPNPWNVITLRKKYKLFCFPVMYELQVNRFHVYFLLDKCHKSMPLSWILMLVQPSFKSLSGSASENQT